ncbi:hypothetical protein F511_06822 [Dorcoceras hygrometricum]|uniref:Uncharacterized protein n=1 Tax=Dorcoceras hygrometricum TaxID=472368 RepID=A0A2Z7A912_9LAMI|nr:hypothetical protein F511_06822 [Dorcoceras hygrometricum]
MASSLFVNTLQVSFTSVLAMEHDGMVRMFKALEDTGLRGFLEGTTLVFESVVTEFFSNARVIAGTIVSTVSGKNLVVTEELFSRTFKIPTEGMQNLSGIPNETITEMRTRQVGTTQPDPIPALTIAPAEFPKYQIPQKGGVDNLDKALDFNDQPERDEHHDHNFTTANVDRFHHIAPTEGEGTFAGDEQRDPGLQDPTTMDINLSDQGIDEVNLEEGLNSDARKEHARQSGPDLVVDARNSSSDDPILLVPNVDEANVADNEQMDHGSEEPENIVPTTVAQIHPDSASEDTYCQSLIASARDKVSAQLAIFEEWTHFRLETEDITELSERRSLILYKILETELEKLYLEHLANFKTGVVSAHHDFECIRRLHQELRLIAAAHRHHRGFVGLPFTTPKSDFVPKFSPALEMYGLTGNTIGSALNKNPYIEQNDNATLNEHQAQENKSLIPIDKHDIRTQDGQNSEARADEGLNAIPISVINPDVTTENTSSHQGLHSSDLQIVASASMESSTLQLLSTTTKTLTKLSTHVQPIDESYFCIRADTLMTKHHTSQLHDQLKKTTDEMYIKMDVLERTLTQRLVDELAVVKSQLAIIVEDLKESGAAKKGEGGSSSRPREGPSGHGLTGGRGGSSSQRGRSDDPSNKYRYTKWF